MITHPAGSENAGPSGLRVDIAATFGDFAIDVRFSAARSECTVLVGPNGAGKSSLIRVLCGLHRAQRGSIIISETPWFDGAKGIALAPQQRSVGVVFQQPRLIPGMSALANVRFGLQAQGLSRRVATHRATAWLEQVGMSHLAKRRARHLSGGEAQRIALARALAIEPAVIILDEPFQSLDAESKSAMRRLVSSCLTDLACVKLIISHDPIDALALADRVIIMEQGVVVQAGTPQEVQSAPRSSYAAAFVGVNLLRGKTVQRDGRPVLRCGEIDLETASTKVRIGEELLACIHPHAITLSIDPPSPTSARNAVRAAVVAIEDVGGRVRVVLGTAPQLTAEITSSSTARLGLHVGASVWAIFKATEVELYPA